MSTALQTLVIVVVIGILASWLVARYGRGWFGIRANDLTAALVGIAGFRNQQNVFSPRCSFLIPKSDGSHFLLVCHGLLNGAIARNKSYRG
jgi:hypothetical protein